MRSIPAISNAPDLYAWMAKTRHPRILQVFDRAWNLINEEREVLSIVARRIGNGPFNLVVEDRVLFSETLNRESPVSIFNNQLAAGDLIFSSAAAECWSPRPGWDMLYDNRDNPACQLAASPGPNFQSPNRISSTLAAALARGDVSASLIRS